MNLAGLVLASNDRYFLAAWTPLAVVGTYGFGLRLAQALSDFVVRPLVAVVPTLHRADDAADAATQRQILAALWPTLAAGGKLLYATCSVFPEENGEQIARFVASQAQATLLAEEQLLPQGDHDGFYYALLQKAR